MVPEIPLTGPRNQDWTKLVARQATEAGLTVTDAELQAAADAFRRLHGLTSAAATTAWLSHQGRTLEDFEQSLEADLLTEKLKEYLTRDGVLPQLNLEEAAVRVSIT
jgi:hypothetical protein